MQSELLGIVLERHRRRSMIPDRSTRTYGGNGTFWHTKNEMKHRIIAQFCDCVPRVALTLDRVAAFH